MLVKSPLTILLRLNLVHEAVPGGKIKPCLTGFKGFKIGL